MEAKEGIRIKFTTHFVRSIKRLTPQLRNKMDERIALFRNYPFHMGLKTHKLSGKHNGCHAFWVTGNHRIIFQFVAENTALFYDFITHDEYDRD